MLIRTHHQALDILHPRTLDALAHQENPDTRPDEKQDTERDGNEPVQRRQLIRASEDDVQRRGVNDEHAEARARDDAGEVVIVADDAFAERERELGLNGKNLDVNGKPQIVLSIEGCLR